MNAQIRESMYQVGLKQLVTLRAERLATMYAEHRCYECPTVYTDLEHYPFCSLECRQGAGKPYSE